MGLVKQVKNKAYYKRFQVKFRRRREGKTDYYARKRLITQDRNKYATPKYRLVVRFSNRIIVAQIIHSKIQGDHVMCAAYSHELPRYGIKAGLSNYPASYCTGLLLARRLLTKLGTDKQFTGKDNLEEDDSIFKPDHAFKACLDVGLTRTTNGNRVFAAMKGCIDGGLNIPFSNKCLYGYKKDTQEFDGNKFRSHVLGAQIAKYMTFLQENKPDTYQSHFSEFIKQGVNADNMEEMYTNAHKLIRENPKSVKSDKQKVTVHKKWHKRKLTLGERKNRIKQKKASALKRAQPETTVDDDAEGMETD